MATDSMLLLFLSWDCTEFKSGDFVTYVIHGWFIGAHVIGRKEKSIEFVIEEKWQHIRTQHSQMFVHLNS